MINLPPEIITFLVTLVPFVDFKLSIPLGTKLGLSLTSSFIFAMAGSIAFAAVTLALLPPITKFIRKKSKTIDKSFITLFEKTKNQHFEKFQKYGPIFVILFVAVPIPGSGVFNGSLIAFIFKIEYWKALTLVSVGTFIACSLVSASFTSISLLTSLF